MLHAGAPVERWQKVRTKIHDEICSQAYNEKLGSFVQSYGSDQLDASLLLMPMTGFLPAYGSAGQGHPEGDRATVDVRRLGAALQHRQVFGWASPGEGVFLACSFWMVRALQLQGRDADARKLFERVLSLANDVGLLAEEYDPGARRLVGNFPQALSHIALVNAAFSLGDPGSGGRLRRSRLLPASNWNIAFFLLPGCGQHCFSPLHQKKRSDRRRNGMHVFEVWAPYARTMEVKIGNERFAMAGKGRGWWSAEVATAGPGTDYGFVIDGLEPALPDPRTRWQPNGVHGESRVVDDAAFAWSDSGWQAPPLSSALIYELHLGTFTPEGTLKAAESRLDYLKDLGVTHVELMPIANFPGKRGWGYDGVDLYAPFNAYGEPDDLKRFVNACHGKGLAVLLDVVYNHLGPVGNYLSKFGPYFTDHHSTPWGDAINFEEAGATEVRRFLIDNALMWLAHYHMDGLRLDAVHAFNDRSAIHFLEQLAGETRRLEAAMGKHFVLIAESDLNDPRTRKSGGGGRIRSRCSME